jgi:hypothetical protein
MSAAMTCDKGCGDTVFFATGVIVRRFAGRTDVTIYAFRRTSLQGREETNP